MKHFFLFTALITFFLVACNSKKNSDKSASGPDTTAAAEGTHPAANAPGETDKIKEELEKMTPLDADALKALLPESLLGAKNSGISTNTAIGTLTASTSYAVSDTSKIVVDIIDCAGPGGAGFFGMQYNSMDEAGGGDEETTYKKVEFNGHRASESCMKNKPGDCTFTYFNGTRFFILVQGEGTGIELLKQAATELKIK